MSNLVIADLMWYKIFIVKFQRYTCDAGDGNFISCVNEYQHWIFPKHSHKRFVSLNALFPEDESQQPQLEIDFLRQISLHNFICVLYAIRYVLRSYLVQSRCEVRKLEYCVWARLVKPTDGWCLCTSLSDLWLCNNWVNATRDLWSGRADSFPLVSHIRACVLGLRNWISIGSGNGWPPVRCQAITQSYPDLLSIAHLTTSVKFE